jgi:hypothetical protein
MRLVMRSSSAAPDRAVACSYSWRKLSSTTWFDFTKFNRFSHSITPNKSHSQLFSEILYRWPRADLTGQAPAEASGTDQFYALRTLSVVGSSFRGTSLPAQGSASILLNDYSKPRRSADLERDLNQNTET